LELADIVGDEPKAFAARMSRDQHIVGSAGPPNSGQLGPYLPEMRRGFRGKGQHLQIIFGVIVRSRIIKDNGEPLEVDYMMRRDGDSWLISDVYWDSAISEVAAHRSEFAAILKKKGTEGLIAALNPKADILTVTAAGSL
jgi:hypothetical protein